MKLKFFAGLGTLNFKRAYERNLLFVSAFTLAIALLNYERNPELKLNEIITIISWFTINDNTFQLLCKTNRQIHRLPQNTFFRTVHETIFWALIMLGKIRRVRKSTQHPKSLWTMWAVENLLLETLWCLFTAPHVGVWQEEELLRTVLFQTGQTRFPAVDGHVILISRKSFPYSAVICNVFSLWYNSVDLIKMMKYNCAFLPILTDNYN